LVERFEGERGPEKIDQDLREIQGKKCKEIRRRLYVGRSKEK
jgi:hypothetical protein